MCETGNSTLKKHTSSLTTPPTFKNYKRKKKTQTFLVDQTEISKTAKDLTPAGVLPTTAKLLVKHQPKQPTFYLPKIPKFNNPDQPIMLNRHSIYQKFPSSTILINPSCSHSAVLLSTSPIILMLCYKHLCSHYLLM